MSEHRKEMSKTSPLDKAARENYQPTAHDLMAELRWQSSQISEMRDDVSEIKPQVQLVVEDIGVIKPQVIKTNGRVTQLESDTSPVVRDYRRLRTLFAAAVIAAPIFFKVMEVALDHVWPTH